MILERSTSYVLLYIITLIFSLKSLKVIIKNRNDSPYKCFLAYLKSFPNEPLVKQRKSEKQKEKEKEVERRPHIITIAPWVLASLVSM